jgi:hypothetical protein
MIQKAFAAVAIVIMCAWSLLQYGAYVISFWAFIRSLFS